MEIRPGGASDAFRVFVWLEHRPASLGMLFKFLRFFVFPPPPAEHVNPEARRAPWSFRKRAGNRFERITWLVLVDTKRAHVVCVSHAHIYCHMDVVSSSRLQPRGNRFTTACLLRRFRIFLGLLLEPGFDSANRSALVFVAIASSC